MKMNMWGLFLLAMSALKMGGRAKRNNYMDIARLRLSLAYAKSVETVRLLFVSLLGVGLCLFLIAFGLLLFHLTIFFYAPWSASVKLWVGLFCSALYFGSALLVFSHVFASNKWLKIFHADTLLDNAISKSSDAAPDNGERF